MKKLIAIHSIHLLVAGKLKEIAPGEVFEPKKGDLDGIPETAYREPTESEEALYDMQQMRRGTTAPPLVMKEPAQPNGPGGATEENVDDKGKSSTVATDVDTTGSSEAGKTTTTDPALAGAAGGVASTASTNSAKAEAESENVSQPKAKAKTAKARSGDDLA